jgi:hypothetical protein
MSKNFGSPKRSSARRKSPETGVGREGRHCIHARQLKCRAERGRQSALDAEVPQSVIAAEQRRYAEMLQPTPRERLTIAQSCERMSIDPVLNMPVEPSDGSLMAEQGVETASCYPGNT